MGKEKDDKNKIEIVSAGAEPGTGGGEEEDGLHPHE